MSTWLPPRLRIIPPREGRSDIVDKGYKKQICPQICYRLSALQSFLSPHIILSLFKMKLAFILSHAFIGMIAHTAAKQNNPNGMIATTNQGPVRGIRAHREVDAFLGIPYAQPPVGKLRFEPPQPHGNRSLTGNGTVFNATRFGPVCYQFHYKTVLGDTLLETSGQSEDCLTLNIFAPRSKSGGRKGQLPVFVWSYGGAFGEGGGSMPLFNPTKFVVENQDIIVVTWK